MQRGGCEMIRRIKAIDLTVYLHSTQWPHYRVKYLLVISEVKNYFAIDFEEANS